MTLTGEEQTELERLCFNASTGNDRSEREIKDFLNRKTEYTPNYNNSLSAYTEKSRKLRSLDRG